MNRNLLIFSLALFALFIPETYASIEGDSASNSIKEEQTFMNVFVVKDKELIVIQWRNLNTENRDIILSDCSGKMMQKTTLYQGSTIAFFDTQTLYEGDYVINISNGVSWFNKEITITK